MPAFGIIASTALASVAVVISYMGANGATVFTTLVLMTGITAAIPYAFSALAQLKWRFRDHQTVDTPRFVRRRRRRRRRARLLAGLHLLLPQHRRHLVRRLGTVPDVRRRRRCSASRSTSRSASR